MDQYYEPLKFIPTTIQLFSLFQMPLTYLLRNKMMLVSKGYNDSDMGKWEFWYFQYIIDEFIKIQEEKDNKNNALAM